MPEYRTARFTFHRTAIDGVFVVERNPVQDQRGQFARLFCAEEFAAVGLLTERPVQINLATTAVAGSVRGLHLQALGEHGPGESKLVTCVAGRVFDIAVDLRPGSATFAQNHAVELMAEGPLSLLIPPGVAHGMQALEDGSTLLYLHGALYDAALERGVRPDDPELAIPWPMPIARLSDRDRSLPLLRASGLT